MEMSHVGDDLHVEVLIHQAEPGKAGLPVMEPAHRIEQVRDAGRACALALFGLLEGGVAVAHLDQDALFPAGLYQLEGAGQLRARW